METPASGQHRTFPAIIRMAFEGKLSKTQIHSLTKGSEYADSAPFQDAEHSYMHAMKAVTQTVEQARVLMEEFTEQKRSMFIDLMKTDSEENAYFELGMGMHPLMDQFSPAHSGFKTWDPDDLGAAYDHVKRELFTLEGVLDSIIAIKLYYWSTLSEL